MNLTLLKNVCDKITDGSHNPPKGVGYSDFLMLSSKNVTANGLNFSGARYLTKEGFIQENKRTDLKVGDILLTIVGTIGRTLVIKDEPNFTLQRSVAVLKPGSSIDSNYLCYCLKSLNVQRQMQRGAKGVAQKGIYLTDLKKLKIPLPPLAEQRRIAAILDKADAIRRKQQQAIDLCGQFLKSLFIDIFGDPVTNPKGWEVGCIGDLLSNVNYGSSSKASLEKKEFPMLRMNNITYEGNWDFSSMKYVDLDDKEKTKYLVHKGELLFNRTNSKELVGKTAVYREKEPMAFAGYLVRAKEKKGIGNNEFIAAFMNSSYGKETLQNMCKSIVGMANINAKEFQKMKIYLPPIDLQNKFAEIRSEVDKRKAKMQKSLERLNNSFNALSQKAFKGEL